MAVMKVKPTRMELTRLKKRYSIAVRGHKLLKDKRDEMMRRFIELIKENKEIREKVEEELSRALGDFLMARALMSSEVFEESVIIELRVAPEDMGKVIGKQGRIAKAIRTVVKAASARERKKYIFEIL